MGIFDIQYRKPHQLIFDFVSPAAILSMSFGCFTEPLYVIPNNADWFTCRFPLTNSPVEIQQVESFDPDEMSELVLGSISWVLFEALATIYKNNGDVP